MGLPIVSTTIIVISVLFPVLAIIAVALRFRARAIQGAGYSSDDLMIVPGLVSWKPHELLNILTQPVICCGIMCE